MTGYIMFFMVICATVTSLLSGRVTLLAESILKSGEQTTELLLSMCGLICLWSGMMKIAERSGICDFLAKALKPLLRKLFKGASNKAYSAIVMNISANLLGLSNAATPLGIIAMKELKEGLREEGRASSAMINFVLINTVGIQLLPTTVAALRMSEGSTEPFSVMIPVISVSFISLAVVLLLSGVFARAKKYE